MTLEPINVARIVYNGMTKLNCSKRDVLFMTPKEYIALWECYLEDHGVKRHDKVASIDDLP